MMPLVLLTVNTSRQVFMARLSISHPRDYSKKRVLSAQASKSRWATGPLSQTLGHLETYCAIFTPFIYEKTEAQRNEVTLFKVTWVMNSHLTLRVGLFPTRSTVNPVSLLIPISLELFKF